jgi:Tat protein translocase TatC
MQPATVSFIVEEAKMRFLWMIFCFFLTSTTCYWFSQDLFFALTTPFLKISKTNFFICTQITESLNTYITISIFLGFFFSIPYILYQLWCFFIPSSNQIQRTSVFKIILLSLIALFLSLMVTFNWILPNIWLFLYKLNNTASDEQFFIIQLQPRIYDFSILTLRILSITALCSQIPLAVISSIQYEIITIEAIINRRRSCAFISILLAALITPPDVWFQLSVCSFIFILIEMAVFSAIVQKHYSNRLSNKVSTCI